MDPLPIITLLTDFGTDDTYVAQMKGMILGIAPHARIVDLTHAVRPQRIEQGAFLLEGALAAFLSGTIHLAVVDPGVGTDRRALAVESGGRRFVGPDNGLLSCALPVDSRPAPSATQPERATVTVSLPDSMRAVAIQAEPGRAVSATFHGRDVFAVAAARLAVGGALRSLGEPVSRMIALPAFRATVRDDGWLTGRVLHIDRFGTAITSIRADDLPRTPRTVMVSGTPITRFVRTYADAEGLVALIGSGGYLEIAEVNGSAAARLGLKIGDPVGAKLG